MLYRMHRRCLGVLAARIGRCQNRAKHPRDQAYAGASSPGRDNVSEAKEDDSGRSEGETATGTGTGRRAEGCT